jgi:hypothetical protein
MLPEDAVMAILGEIVKLFLEKEIKEGKDVPPVDPTEIARLVRDFMVNLLDIKKSHIQVSSGKAVLDKTLFLENIKESLRSMRFRVEKKKIVLNVIPIVKVEYTYEIRFA